jgi:hypothetical protein
MQCNWLIVLCALAATAAIAGPSSQPVVTQVKPPSRPNVNYAYSVINPREVDFSVKAFATGLFSSLDLKLMRGFASPGSVVRGEGDFG